MAGGDAMMGVVKRGEPAYQHVHYWINVLGDTFKVQLKKKTFKLFSEHVMDMLRTFFLREC